MNRTFHGLTKWCFVVICIVTFLVASLAISPTSRAFAATAPHQTQTHPLCVTQRLVSCGGCIGVQKDYSQQSLGGYILEVYLYLGYDSSTGYYCGWAQAHAWVYQPTNQQVGTLTATVCGGGCGSSSVNVAPRSSGTWWSTGYATSYPAANQCATGSATYLSLQTSTHCIVP